MGKYSGKKSKNINSLCDEIFYCNNTTNQQNATICPLMAGITHPDPEYFIRCRSNNEQNRHLFVLEYVVSGKGYIESGGRHYTVSAGDFYLLNRYTSPYYRADAEDPFEKIWLNISGRFMYALSYTYRISEPVLIVHCEAAEKYLRLIHEELKKYPNDVTQCYPELMHLLLSLFREVDLARNVKESMRNTVSFNQVSDYIATNILSKYLDMEHIGNFFYISYSSLYRMCMKHTGLSPKHYILKMKIEYAQNLFLSTNCSITHASEILNFSSPSYFRRVFRKYASVSPAQWKKQQCRG